MLRRSRPLLAAGLSVAGRSAAGPSVAALPACALLTLVTLAGCAPAAKPASGEVGDQVQEALASGAASFDHAQWDDLLRAGTRNGLADYRYMAAHRDQLDSYLAAIAKANLGQLSRDHLMALLINAYNAYTVQSILEHPGVSSIREIDGVWSDATHPVGGFELTLDNIEHNLLRPYFKDPRIHVAVNCASQSCAPLPPFAFEGDSLDQQLDEWTRAFFADPKYLQLDGDKLRISPLLDWYGDDFTAADADPRADDLPSFIARYASAEVRAFIEERGGKVEIAFLNYDWSLNQAPVRPQS